MKPEDSKSGNRGIFADNKLQASLKQGSKLRAGLGQLAFRKIHSVANWKYFIFSHFTGNCISNDLRAVILATEKGKIQ